MDYVAGHQYERHPQGADYCTVRGEDGEFCGLLLAEHQLGESEIIDGAGA